MANPTTFTFSRMVRYMRQLRVIRRLLAGTGYVPYLAIGQREGTIIVRVLRVEVTQ